VFDFERRIYRIDTVRLNPSGIPLRGVLYCAALVAIAGLATRLPLLGLLLAPIPWYLRYLGLPICAGALLGAVRIDGRPFHLAAASLMRGAVGPKAFSRLEPCRRAGARWRPGPIVLIPNGSDARFRHLRYAGPGLVLVGRAHRRLEWPALRPTRADVTLEGGDGILARASCIELTAAGTIEVRAGQSAG
jgi:hypothetical protein